MSRHEVTDQERASLRAGRWPDDVTVYRPWHKGTAGARPGARIAEFTGTLSPCGKAVHTVRTRTRSPLRAALCDGWRLDRVEALRDALADVEFHIALMRGHAADMERIAAALQQEIAAAGGPA